MFFLDSNLIDNEEMYRRCNLEYIKKIIIRAMVHNISGADKYTDNQIDSFECFKDINFVFFDIARRIKKQKGKRELKSYLHALKKVIG